MVLSIYIPSLVVNVRKFYKVDFLIFHPPQSNFVKYKSILCHHKMLTTWSFLDYLCYSHVDPLIKCGVELFIVCSIKDFSCISPLCLILWIEGPLIGPVSQSMLLYKVSNQSTRLFETFPLMFSLL